MAEDVAEDERGRLEPGDPPQRREVGPDDEVAVAELPVRDLVAGHRIHVHVEREQVVARLDPVLGDALLDEVLRRAARLPMRRPCMSVNATTTVSIEPSPTALPQLLQGQHGEGA